MRDELNTARAEYVQAERDAERQRQDEIAQARREFQAGANAVEFQQRLDVIDQVYWKKIDEATDRYHQVAVDYFDDYYEWE